MEQDVYAKLFWQGMKKYVDHQKDVNQPVQDGMEDYLVLSRQLLEDYQRQSIRKERDRINAIILSHGLSEELVSIIEEINKEK